MKNIMRILNIFIAILFFSYSLVAKNETQNSYMDLYLKAYEFYKKDSFELAIKYSTEAINVKKKSDYFVCHLIRAQSNYALNNYKEAKDDLEYISKNFKSKFSDMSEKTDIVNMYNLELAKCFLKLGLINSANNILNTIIKTSSRFDMKAVAYAYLNNKDSSFFYIKKADSNSDSIRKNTITTNKLIIIDELTRFRKFILYNILNEKELALQNLELALEENYHKFRYLEISNDFLEIRKDERFIALINKYKEKYNKINQNNHNSE